MCVRVTVLVLLLCGIFNRFHAPADASTSSSFRSHDVLLSCVFEVKPKPLNMSLLTVQWLHDARPLVEFRNNSLVSHDPRALLSVEQLRKENASLVLTNPTLSDSGNYTCVLQYGKTTELIHIVLTVQEERIQIYAVPHPREKYDDSSNTEIHQRSNSIDDDIDAIPSPKVLTTGLSTQHTPKAKSYLSMEISKEVSVQMGSNVSLNCTFNIRPSMSLNDLTVHWSKDGVTRTFMNKTYIYPPGYNMPEEKLFQGLTDLKLKNVSRNDTGVYTCFIKYRTMKASTNITLTIKAYKELKIGMVLSVLSISGSLVFLFYFCFAG
ncbi:uncharacterized protein LOC128641701 isoform X2 [Bombina bombina]|uniref:uncharacterized protein LOC128641701 isoform X2 n=1 Tax=Bombina bombina TaxID=8345 RepID=UPI00235B2AB6|nr:uncharacterized protein LOC128641701 isoform X2 [Bombina bombina]